LPFLYAGRNGFAPRHIIFSLSLREGFGDRLFAIFTAGISAGIRDNGRSEPQQLAKYL
jgi:hypothetical protein